MLKISLCLTPLLLFATQSHSQIVNGNLEIKATVVSGCDFESGGGDALLDFGLLTHFEEAHRAVTAPGSGIRLICTSGQEYSVGLDGGLDPYLIQRRMTSASSTSKIFYYLYQPDGTSYWGNDRGSNTVDGVGTGEAVEYAVNGFIAPYQWQDGPIASGNYSDTVTISIYF
ncbi:hypothetical protein GA830_00860 [Mesorhizobium sp. NBSH29]|uniref:Csu type fimbrial protein n=1 Tax=Mesorhizobium sp. NBSH29 TaxID=2654249 RepID=UPI0018967086|nr:hypothetical protein GA830_00860 [Mesorhizobium sp. NBSH29]